MSVFNGKWITAHEFLKLSPISIFTRENAPLTGYFHEEGLKNFHIKVKKEFDFSGAKKVIIRLTADDYFKLYINGKFVGQGPTPGYYFCYYYNEFDITEFLNLGTNEITLDVYYQGLINRVWNSGDYRMGMIADIIADEKLILTTDESWQYCVCQAFSGEANIGYKTQFSECFDSRVNCDEFVFCAVKEVDYTFNTSSSVPLQIYDKTPVTEKRENGAVFLDFGTEITATAKITARGKSGDIVLIHYAEELNEDGSLRYQMRCNCHYEDKWILKDGESVFEGFDYKAFRYMEILPQDGGVKIDRALATVRHYPFDDNACTIESNDEILNAVFNICKNGVKYGSQEVFVDCPSREKGQYAGDLTVTGASHIYLTGDISLFEKAIINQAQSTFITDGIMAVTPGALMQEIADYSLQFPILLLRHYMHTGDKEFLRKMLPVAEKMLDHFKKFDRGDGLLEGVDSWNLVDWPQNLRDDYDFALTKPIGKGCHNVINAFYIGCTRQIEQIKGILGIEANSGSEKLRQRYNQVFFDEQSGLYVDSEGSKHSALHSNIIPLYYGLQPEESTNKIADFLIKKGLVCGVYMAYFYLKALVSAGRYDAVYNAIVNQSETSWYNMVREGGTTCFEAWGKEQKFNTSLCHPWASGPVSVIVEDIIGLKCITPGWDEFKVEPHLPDNIEIKATIPLINQHLEIFIKENKVNFGYIK